MIIYDYTPLLIYEVIQNNCGEVILQFVSILQIMDSAFHVPVILALTTEPSETPVTIQ